MTDFVTIANYDEYLTANFDLQKLQEQEIDCYLADENTITAKWILKNALGGIKLRVSGEQVDRALQILNEKSEETPIDFKIEEKNDDVICPECNSNNTGTEKYSKAIVGFSWLLLGFPINISVIKSHRCFYCNHRWQT